MKNIKKSQILKTKDLINIKANQTISKMIYDHNSYIMLLSLGKDTDISAESTNDNRIYINLEGDIDIKDLSLKEGQLIAFDKNIDLPIKAYRDSIIVEIAIKETDMKNIDKAKIINLKDILDYEESSISNLDIVSKDDLKIMLMAFDKEESLKPHQAPGDALLMALEGEAIIGIDKEEFSIKEGEQIVLPKNISHYVKALSKFKMLLILAIDK